MTELEQVSELQQQFPELSEGRVDELLDMMMAMGSHERMARLEDEWLVNGWTRAEKRLLLLECWTGTNLEIGWCIPSAASLVGMFREVGFMTDVEKPRLPDPFPVFRGCTDPEEPSLGWTADIEVASDSAIDLCRLGPDGGLTYLLKAYCPHSAWLGFLNKRGQSETIVDPDDLTGGRVIETFDRSRFEWTWV